MIITDDNVVQHLKNKNEKAIPFIIHQYGGLLSAIIRRHLNYQQQDYEECLDDVLLAVWKHIHSFDPARNSFQQWVAAIAKYKAIDYRRKQITLQNRQLSVAEIDDAMMTNDYQASSNDLSILLEQLLPRERKIFERYYLEGNSTGEIAQEFQVKESWVHNKLSRGRKKLREYFVHFVRNNEG